MRRTILAFALLALAPSTSALAKRQGDDAGGRRRIVVRAPRPTRVARLPGPDARSTTPPAPGWMPIPFPSTLPVPIAPPHPVADPRPVPLSRGYVWIPGFWAWNGRQFDWYHGRWESPRPGYRWVGPRWSKKGINWHFFAGRWHRAG